jgi:hypothetical protein
MVPMQKMRRGAFFRGRLLDHAGAFFQQLKEEGQGMGG